jgi:hypothetical protein
MQIDSFANLFQLISLWKFDMDEHLRIGTGCVSERVLWQLQDDDLDPFTGLRYLIWPPETRRGGDEQDYRTRYSKRDLYIVEEKSYLVRKNSNSRTARRLDRRWIATADPFFLIIKLTLSSSEGKKSGDNRRGTGHVISSRPGYFRRYHNG